MQVILVVQLPLAGFMWRAAQSIAQGLDEDDEAAS